MPTEDELREILCAHARRYPVFTCQDAVKLVYQRRFGGGHLITDPKTSLRRLQNEMESCAEQDTGYAELLEDIGRGLVRIHLLKAERMGIPAQRIHEAFVQSALEVQKDQGSTEAFRADLLCLQTLACSDASPFPFSVQEMKMFLSLYEASGFPMVSHSDAFRKAYKPAYRVILKRLW